MKHFWDKTKKIRVLKEGKFIRLLERDTWEFVQRKNCTGIVVILAMTEDHQLILTEQFRMPVAKRVIEFPAGLVNDREGAPHETSLGAAKRELIEETGYRARRMKKILHGPVAGGMSSDYMTVFLAEDLCKIGEGGGDATEFIRVHAVPWEEVEGWLETKRRGRALVDPKIYAGLYLLNNYNKTSKRTKKRV